MKNLARSLLEASRAAQFEAQTYGSVPDEGLPAYSQQVLPRALFLNTRGYLEKLVNQINGSYEKGWFDGCAVLMRRLIETLIIEAFEKHQIAQNIKGPSGDFLFLRDLINKALSSSSWNLSRNTKQSLNKLKDIGDKSAHSRRFIARRWDIDKVVDDLRVVAEEFLYLSGLR